MMGNSHRSRILDWLRERDFELPDGAVLIPSPLNNEAWMLRGVDLETVGQIAAEVRRANGWARILESGTLVADMKPEWNEE